MTEPTSHLENFHGGRVLDVAAGRGGSIQFWIEHLPKYDEIVGIDIKPVDDATRTHFADKKVSFIQMDAARMDFRDESFDAIGISHSLHHLDDLSVVLVEMLRVLKPGGIFLVNEMYRDQQAETQLTHVYLHHWWGAVDTALGVSHFETFTRQAILDLVNSLHLERVVIQDLRDLEGDPKSAEQLGQLNAVIDQYNQRIEGLPNRAELQAQGEILRKRLNEIGVHGATTLLAIGRKPQ